MNIIDDSFDVEVDDGLAAGGRFQEAEVIGVVVEEALREGCCAGGPGEDGEVGLEVGVSVSVVFPDLVAGEVEGLGRKNHWFLSVFQ